MLSFEDSAEGKPLRLYEQRIDFDQGEPIRHDGPVRALDYDDKAPLAEELKYFAENARSKILKADATNAIEVLEILEQATAQLDGAG